MENFSRKKVLELIKGKTTVKRDVFENSKLLFNEFKKALAATGEELINQSKTKNPIHIQITDKGQYEIRIKVGGDTIIFLMHSNVFDFEKSHRIHKTSYLKKDPYASLCSQIYVYNFLSDSFKYNRINDIGYLVARIFINKDGHFFMEGKKQLAFLFNNFENDIFNVSNMQKLIDEVILYCLEFDLLIPPYDNFAEVTVDQIEEVSNNLKFQTGKRLGFQLKAGDNFE